MVHYIHSIEPLRENGRGGSDRNAVGATYLTDLTPWFVRSFVPKPLSVPFESP